MAEPTRVRVASAAILFAVLVVGGGVLLWVMTDHTYSLFESIYFALYTVATVGYGELPGMESSRPARAVAMVLMVTGVAAIAFFQSTLTTMLVEGAIGRVFRRTRMDRRIASLKNHTVVCGCGRTGKFVAEELAAAHLPFVAIDIDEGQLERLNDELGGKLLYVAGDATEDDVLMAAGIERAGGVVAAMPEDRDNLFVTVAARSFNPRARIVAKAVTIGTEAKLQRAGANATVSPHQIGGLRLVTELIRPYTAEFLDSMMRGSGEDQLRFEDVEIRGGGPYEGSRLLDAPIRSEANVLVVAIRRPDGTFVYNPSAEQTLDRGASVVVLGTAEGVRRLREMLGSD
jgi:voltage-gated potassium channel